MVRPWRVLRARPYDWPAFAITVIFCAFTATCDRTSPPVADLTPANLDEPAILALENECQTGDAYKCFRLAGYLASKSAATIEEAKRAIELSRTACDRGLLLACYQSARFYEDGIGVFPDPREAGRRYRRLCARRHLSACYRRALLILKGVGVNKEGDPARARTLLEQTCHHQMLNNCRDIAREVHVRERRITRRQSEYHVCTRGWNLACHELGEMYSNSDSIPADPVRAQLMFERACSRGHEESCQRMESISSEIADEIGADETTPTAPATATKTATDAPRKKPANKTKGGQPAAAQPKLNGN